VYTGTWEIPGGLDANEKDWLMFEKLPPALIVPAMPMLIAFLP